MATFFEKQAKIARTAAMSDAQAWALSNGIRRIITRILYRKTMTISEIAAAVGPEGIDKARTSIRHHVNILRDAGVVEVVKIVPVRGTVEKHYTATTRVLGYDVPDGFDEAHSADIRAAARRVEKIVARLPRAADGDQSDGAGPDYDHFVLAEIVNRAMTQVLEARNNNNNGGGGKGAPPAKPASKPSRRGGGGGAGGARARAPL